jgi:hypothetical protein
MITNAFYCSVRNQAEVDFLRHLAREKQIPFYNEYKLNDHPDFAHFGIWRDHDGKTTVVGVAKKICPVTNEGEEITLIDMITRLENHRPKIDIFNDGRTSICATSEGMVLTIEGKTTTLSHGLAKDLCAHYNKWLKKNDL